MKNPPLCKRAATLALPLALLTLPAIAAAAPADEVPLAEIVVKGQGLGVSRHQPYSVQQFSAEDFRERQVAQPEQLFREVAGMEVRGLGYGGVANSMTLRGFSGGGHGGDIGFVLDGIPLNESSSHADGYADLNVVVPLELAGMDVFKGPVSALYGNYNRAGVVALESRKGGAYRQLEMRGGSNSTLDAQAALGTQVGGATLNAAAQIYRSDGYRPQSANERGTLAGRLAFALAPDTRLAFSGRIHRAEADTASVITQAQYDDRSSFYAKNPNVQNDASDKDFQTLRADLAHTLAPNLKVLVFAYATHQTFTRYFTRLTNATTWQQRMEDYDRDVSGFGASLNGSDTLLGRPVRWIAGIERYSEDTRYKYFDALDRRNPTAATFTAGINGGAGTLDRNLAIDSTAFFAQAEWQIDPLFRPSLGLRRDRIDGGCERRGIETRSGASAQCSAMPEFAVNTPKLGVRSALAPGWLEARASVAEGFALPSDAAKFTAGLGVEPTVFRQRELGMTLTPGTDWLIDLARFRTDSRDEVALLDASTLTYGNLGRTRREGWEGEIRYAPSSWFEATAVLARTRTEVTETRAGTPWLQGAEITGVPRHLATLSATVRPLPALALTAIARAVGSHVIRQPASAGDTQVHRYGGYRTVDLLASYDLPGARRTRLTVRIDNLTDRRYATSAGVTGGVTTYNPAAPRSVMLGVSVDL